MQRRRRESDLEQVNLLELAPVRLAEWEMVGDRVVVHRPAPTVGGLRGLLERFLTQLSARRIRLDEIGSFVWQELDGEQTVGQVAQRLREHFGEQVDPVEERLGHLVRALHREKLVGYRGWDDVGTRDRARP